MKKQQYIYGAFNTTELNRLSDIVFGVFRENVHQIKKSTGYSAFHTTDFVILGLFRENVHKI